VQGVPVKRPGAWPNTGHSGHGGGPPGCQGYQEPSPAVPNPPGPARARAPAAGTGPTVTSLAQWHDIRQGKTGPTNPGTSRPPRSGRAWATACIGQATARPELRPAPDTSFPSGDNFRAAGRTRAGPSPQPAANQRLAHSRRCSTPRAVCPCSNQVQNGEWSGHEPGGTVPKAVQPGLTLPRPTPAGSQNPAHQPRAISRSTHSGARVPRSALESAPSPWQSQKGPAAGPWGPLAGLTVRIAAPGRTMEAGTPGRTPQSVARHEVHPRTSGHR